MGSAVPYEIVHVNVVNTRMYVFRYIGIIKGLGK